jgi:peptidoglycan hydrolase-like protein with peptidoglycan-binding domain
MKKFNLISRVLVGAVLCMAVAAPFGVSAASVPTKTVASAATSAAASTSLSAPAVVTPDFNYGPDGGPSADAIIAEGGIIQLGDVGYAVKQVQTQLNNSPYGYIVAVDGRFGSDTQAVVKIFQSAYGLTPDGIVGPNTLAKLDLWK